MNKNFRFTRRQITGGPNREDLFDSVRLGRDVSRLDVVFFEKRYKHVIRHVPILSVERIYEEELWAIRFNIGGKVFEAFYSTRTRTGYLCNTRKIHIWQNGMIYRPLTDHQLMCMLQLADVADNIRFSKHILTRIIHAVKGAEEFYSWDSEDFSKETPDVRDRILSVKKLFQKTFKKQKNEGTILEFKKLLG